MASKGEVLVAKYLSLFLKQYNIDEFETEVQTGFNGSRYDFFIRTNPPIAIEFDGENHFKYNDHFFNSIEHFQEYKGNDNLKNYRNNIGDVYLIRISNLNLSFKEFCKLFEGYEEVLKNGIEKKEKKEWKQNEEYKAKQEQYKEQQKNKARQFNRECYKINKEKQKNKSNKNNKKNLKDLFK